MWEALELAKIKNVLPDKAAGKLTRYLAISGASLTHPRDTERFYLFVIHCHRYRIKLTPFEFKTLLINAGCQKDRSEYLADIYQRGRELLKVNMWVR